MKQTAVEWFATYLKGITSLNCDEIIEQAKEMEKQQIMEFAYSAVRKILNEDRENPFNLEQYYNETYKEDKQ